MNFMNIFLLLSEAIYLLVSSSITTHDLARAEILLLTFCFEFTYYYGLRFISMNIHQLVHLVDNVRALGPLWTHSCFSFEDKNAFLLGIFHGTQNIQFQIVSALCMMKQLPVMAEKYLTEDSSFKTFYNHITKNLPQSQNHHLHCTWSLSQVYP